MARRSSPLSPAEVVITDSMGRLAEFWGLKRNFGRAWAVLYLEGRPLAAEDLQKRLTLSTGAVSMTLREIQRWGVARRVWMPGERRKLYEVEVDVWRMLSRLFKERELREVEVAIDSLERALEDLRRHAIEAGDGGALARKAARVEQLLDLLRMLASMLRVFVATGRLDAAVLAAFRLGGGGEVSPEGDRGPRT